jgi:hypothetical protein
VLCRFLSFVVAILKVKTNFRYKNKKGCLISLLVRQPLFGGVSHQRKRRGLFTQPPEKSILPPKAVEYFSNTPIFFVQAKAFEVKLPGYIIEKGEVWAEKIYFPELFKSCNFQDFLAEAVVSRDI